VSAREASRRLGEDKWKPVIGQLAMALPSARLVLVWSPGTSDDPRHPGDDLMAARLLAMGPRLNLVAAPTAALPDLMAVLAACDLFIGADGGAMHVAAGLGVPTVALFENLPAKLRHWAPWQVPHELVVSPNFAIGDIAPESIVGATLRLIDRGALNP
jgi:ADP-heptose:LPS heptosyltransferase